MSVVAGGTGRRSGGLTRGDTLESMSLQNAFKSQSLLGAGSDVGMSCVLWLPEGPPDPIAAAMWAGRVESFQAAGAVIGVIVDDAPVRAGQVPPELVPALMSDPDGRVRTAIGLSGPGIAVFEPDFRLAELVEGNRLEPALAACTRVFKRSRPTPVNTSAAPVLIVHDVLEPELCAALIDYWEAGEKNFDLAMTSDGRKVDSDGYKRRGDVALDDLGLQREVAARLSRRVSPQLFKAFGFKAAKHERLAIGCYDSTDAGAFSRHRDNIAPITAHRQFAMSLNLNTGEYEGGALWFPEYGRQVYQMGLGGAALFSCSVLHEALPVISGRRFGLFTFLSDADAVPLDREPLQWGTL